MRQRLFWLPLRDHHHDREPWKVFLVDELDGVPEGSGGSTDPKTREIELLASHPYKRLVELLGHEIVHAVCDRPDAPSFADVGGEEHVARYAEDSLMPIMFSIGARLPPLPTGFASLRRSAIRIEQRKASK